MGKLCELCPYGKPYGYPHYLDIFYHFCNKMQKDANKLLKDAFYIPHIYYISVSVLKFCRSSILLCALRHSSQYCTVLQ